MKSMKKFLTLFAGFALALVMVFSLAGCGSDNEDESTGGKANVQDDDDKDDSTAGKLLNSKMFASVQEYLDAQKDQVDAVIEQNKNSGMSMEVKADGDTLIYRYVYDETVTVTQYVIDSFDSSLDLYKSQFESILDEMEKYIDAKNPAVQLLYENPDGSLVYSCLFTSDGVKTTPGTIVEGESEKMFATVQDYVAAQQDLIDEAKSSLEGSGMVMDIQADGDTLIYRYTYEMVVEATEELAAEFEANLSMYQAQFDAVIEQLVDVENPTVRLIYEDSEGTVLYTHTFTK